MIYDQAEFDVRCEWGAQGIAELSSISDAIIIVDLLSFSTCVSVAAGRGARIYPSSPTTAAELARSNGCILAGHRGSPGYSLSPASLMTIPAGTALVLPSPNGSLLSLMTGHTPTFAGCLRNASAVAKAALAYGKRIAVIPAGERWGVDGSLRPAWEDLIGAGAIVSHLEGTLSPEAQLASDAYHAAASCLLSRLMACSSGKELIGSGFANDVEIASELDAEGGAPQFVDGAYQPAR